MPVKTTYPFRVPIYTIKCSDWETKKQKLLGLVDFEDPECMLKEQYSDYHKYKDHSPYKEQFIEIIKDELIAFSKTVQTDILVRALWCQRYAKSEFMGVHNHGALGYSAVLYAEFTGGHSATQFYAPFNNFIKGSLIDYVPEVEEGDLIVFPSALAHSATPNKSSDYRTIFSFNMTLG